LYVYNSFGLSRVGDQWNSVSCRAHRLSAPPHSVGASTCACLEHHSVIRLHLEDRQAWYLVCPSIYLLWVLRIIKTINN
jgi:hypothetical protein